VYDGVSCQGCVGSKSNSCEDGRKTHVEDIFRTGIGFRMIAEVCYELDFAGEG
jgi:hypothetical protein